MRSGWFWGTDMWQRYLQEYAKTRPECLHEWKSSPLANDHDFSKRKMNTTYCETEHQSQVIDLRTHKWSDVRKSYRGIINKAIKSGVASDPTTVGALFRMIHRNVFGDARSEETYNIQGDWMRQGYGYLVVTHRPTSHNETNYLSAAYWIVYQNRAYYASGPSLEENVQHLAVWTSLTLLKARGVELVDMGQIDADEAGTRGVFKRGFGGEPKPFTIVRRWL